MNADEKHAETINRSAVCLSISLDDDDDQLYPSIHHLTADYRTSKSIYQFDSIRQDDNILVFIIFAPSKA